MAKVKNIKSSTFPLMVLLFIGNLSAGRIIGSVRNSQTSRPLENVLITIQQTDSTVKTDSTGSYISNELKPGSYTLFYSRDGFELLTRIDIYVSGAADKRVDVDLLPLIHELDKVTVRSTSFRKAPDMASSTKLINIDEILRSPGGLVDVQRVVQNLPSVASGGDNVNEVIVRGGVPGENLFIMDNIDIPNPNHFAQQGSGGGVVSLINPLLVRGLTFNAGAPPSQYG